MRNMKTVNYDGMFTLSAPSPKWVWDKSGQLVEVPAGQPAWDHDPVTGEPLGQLIEAVEATNGHPNGKLNSAVSGYTITDPSDPYMPDAKVLTDDVGHLGAGHTSLGSTYPFGSAGGSKSYGLRVIYAKEGLSRYVSVRTASGPTGFTFDLVNKEVLPGSLQGGSEIVHVRKLAGGWWELGFSLSWVSAGASANQYDVSFGSSASGYNVTSQIGDQITIAYPSMFDTNIRSPGSIIITDGTAVTRAADIVSANAAFANNYDPAQGWLFIDYDASPAARWIFQSEVAGATHNNANSFVIINSEIVLFEGTTKALSALGDQTGHHKFLLSWEDNNVKAYKDGQLLFSGQYIMPDWVRVIFFRRTDDDGSSSSNGRLRAFHMGDVISDEDAIARTTL